MQATITTPTSTANRFTAARADHGLPAFWHIGFGAVADARARHDPGAATHMLMLLGETQKAASLDDDARTTLAEALRLAQGVGIEHLKEQIAGTLAELTEG